MNLQTHYFTKIWLNIAISLVVLMVFIGGLTRLTESGLSITEWNIISGILPPFSESAWQLLFAKYQKIPEFFIENHDMTIAGFKRIFWLEYIHRLLGRITGIFIIIPSLLLLFNHSFRHKKLLIILLILIPMQALVGWLMVKSGLTLRIDVSHFRLALHLLLALVILLVLLEIKLKLSRIKIQTFRLNNWSVILMLILIQITFGAFVAGLKAGYLYNTYPLMAGSFIPSDLLYYDSVFLNIIYHPTMIQFIHRNLGLLILSLATFVLINSYRSLQKQDQGSYAIIFALILFIQFVLGVLTLITGVNIMLALMHQLVAVALLSVSYIIFRRVER